MPADDLSALPAPTLGRYRHYKGGEYELVGVVRHSETLEALVLYRPLRGRGDLWVRPYAMFFEHVDVDGASRPRFAPIAGAPSEEGRTSASRRGRADA